MQHETTHRIKIISETTFGQGDSTTETWAECLTCGKATDKLSYYDFPTDEKLREAQELMKQ